MSWRWRPCSSASDPRSGPVTTLGEAMMRGAGRPAAVAAESSVGATRASMVSASEFVGWVITPSATAPAMASMRGRTAPTRIGGAPRPSWGPGLK